MILADRTTYSCSRPLSRPQQAQRPIRILELRCVQGTGGGPDKTILLGAAQSDPSRYAVTVCYLRDVRDKSFAIDRRAAQLDLDYVEVRERRSFDPAIWPALRRVIRERQIDIVHSHCYKTDPLALCLGRAERVVALSTAHGWIANTWKEKLYSFLDRRVLAKFPMVIAVSEPIRNTLIRHGANPSRVRKVLNGIDPDMFQRRNGTREEMRRRVGIPQDAIVLGAVGRLSNEKRFDLLLEATAMLSQNPSPYVVIAGEGDSRPELESLANKLGFGDRFRLLGQRSDIREVHQILDVYVQSSDTEGVSNTLLEAMALETPVVATDVGGTSELIDHEVHGLLVPRRDPQALARAIRCVLDNAVARGRMVRGARRRIEEEFSFRSRMRAVEAIYDELAAERR